MKFPWIVAGVLLFAGSTLMAAPTQARPKLSEKIKKQASGAVKKAVAKVRRTPAAPSGKPTGKPGSTSSTTTGKSGRPDASTARKTGEIPASTHNAPATVPSFNPAGMGEQGGNGNTANDGEAANAGDTSDYQLSRNSDGSAEVIGGGLISNAGAPTSNRDSAPPPQIPLDMPMPDGTAPTGTAPDGTAPDGTAPDDSAPALAGPDIAFVTDAIDKSAQGGAPSDRWQVTAHVQINKTKGESKMSAVGLVTAAGSHLQGILPLSISDADSSASSLEIIIGRSGRVGLRQLVAGKPFLSRPMEFFPTLFIQTPTAPTLFKKINWNNAERIMVISLTVEKAKPIGKRYKITGRLVVTNSEDGVLDNTVEIMGVLVYYQRGDGSAAGKAAGKTSEKTLLTIIKQDMNKGSTLPFNQNIFVDHIFADPKTEYLVVRGSIYDDDAGVDDDAMLVDQTRALPLATLAKPGEYHLAGDGNSESCDVYFTVTEVKDLY